jgi:hypothetical protein
MLRPKGPPRSIDCMTCGAKMTLTAAEPKDYRIVYTYRCPSAHLQQLAIAGPDVPGIPRRGRAWLGAASVTSLRQRAPQAAKEADQFRSREGAARL